MASHDGEGGETGPGRDGGGTWGGSSGAGARGGQPRGLPAVPEARPGVCARPGPGADQARFRPAASTAASACGRVRRPGARPGSQWHGGLGAKGEGKASGQGTVGCRLYKVGRGDGSREAGGDGPCSRCCLCSCTTRQPGWGVCRIRRRDRAGNLRLRGCQGRRETTGAASAPGRGLAQGCLRPGPGGCGRGWRGQAAKRGRRALWIPEVPRTARLPGGAAVSCLGRHLDFGRARPGWLGRGTQAAAGGPVGGRLGRARAATCRRS